jgi:hypothetical protein
MRDPVLHVIKDMARNQKEINEVEQTIYDLRSREKELLETNNHLLTELIKQVQIDCNEEDLNREALNMEASNSGTLNNEIKETLITGGALWQE